MPGVIEPVQVVNADARLPRDAAIDRHGDMNERAGRHRIDQAVQLGGTLM
jgi:hypothetical protein